MAKLITDSSCDFNDFLLDTTELDFELIPVTLQVDDVDYVDDANLDSIEFLKIVENSVRGSKSAAPSPELFLKAFENTDDTEIYVVTMTSVLSGTFNSATLAKKLYEEQHPDKPKEIYIIDSLTGTAGHTSACCYLKNQFLLGIRHQLLFEKVSDFAKNELKTVFILQSYDNLAKTGRINPSIAKIASMLSIRTICKADEGAIIMTDKYRGAKAYDKLIDMVLAEKSDLSERILTITHVQAPELAEKVKSSVEKSSLNFKNIIINRPSGNSINYALRKGLILGY